MYTVIIKGMPSVANKALQERIPGIRATNFRATCPPGKHYASETHFHIHGHDEMSASSLYLTLARWFNGPEECIQGKGFPDGTLLHFSID